ncbi:hypothetical protein WAK64_08445 [Bacillus spongiae]|uniref:Uncharacterized protein n=1 Tax=Bacillus spongiae TaxID=2683610 RepID=A0ABU8HD72_9BACI
MNKEKQWLKWEKTRRMGKWKFILFISLLAGGISFITQLLVDVYQQDLLLFKVYLWTAIPFGFTFGICRWMINESRYKKYITNK